MSPQHHIIKEYSRKSKPNQTSSFFTNRNIKYVNTLEKTQNTECFNNRKYSQFHTPDNDTKRYDNENKETLRFIQYENSKKYEDINTRDKHITLKLSPNILIKAEEYMAAWCFDILINAIKKRDKTPPPPQKLLLLSDSNFKSPIFVTWLKSYSRFEKFDKSGKKISPFQSTSNFLRGCIGCLSPIPILELREYAILSGLRDYRFPPISLDELSSLTCKISLLNKFEKCSHIYDWKIGEHGIIINFTGYNGKRFSSTFLPEVAVEHNFNQKMAINKLIRKANYHGTINDTFLNCIEVIRYQSSIVSLSYDTYKEKFSNYEL